MQAQVDEVSEEVSIHLSDGTNIKLRLRPATRWMRDQAYRVATQAHKRETGETGASIQAFEEEWAKQRIISWATDNSANPMKAHVTNGGWRLLSNEAGDLIAAAIGVNAALESVMNRLVGRLTSEAERAKNLQPGPASSTPESPSTTMSGVP